MTELTERLERGAQLETPGQAEPPSARAVSMWRIFFVGVILLFIVLLAVGLWKTIKDGQRAAGEAPELSFATFDGEEVVLRDLRGKGVVVNFWASWCAPCREEAALLEQTWRREQDNAIVFLGPGH